MDLTNNNRDQDMPASMFESVQRRLASTNRPGHSEEDLDIGKTRSQRPSISAARAAYQEAVEIFKVLLDELFEPDLTLAVCQSRKSRYRKLIPLRRWSGSFCGTKPTLSWSLCPTKVHVLTLWELKTRWFLYNCNCCV